LISRLLKNTYHLAVYTIGISVLLVAIVATAIRLLLPDIGTYRSEIESWVSNYTNLPVAIRAIEADWQGWTPRLYLEDIDLLSRDANSPIINFAEAQMSIDLLASLKYRQIIPKQLTISGFSIAVIREQDGSIDIEGIRVDNYQDQENRNDELANWLFGQSYIELQNISVEWIDKKHHQDSISLTETNLRLRTDGSRMQIEGAAMLPDSYGDSMNFAIDVTGNLLGSEWTAELFMHGTNINPDSWYRAYWPADIMVIGGNATTSIWSVWENARLSRVDGFLDYNDFHVQMAENQQLEVKQLHFLFSGIESTGDNWLMNIQFQDVITENGYWPEADIALLLEQQSEGVVNYSAHFNYLKLDDVMPVVRGLSFLPSAAREIFSDMNLTGELIDGELSVNSGSARNDDIQFDLGFRQLSLQQDDPVFPLSNLSGRTSGSLARGKLVFDRDIASLDTGTDTADIDDTLTLDGELQWLTLENGNYRLATEHFQIVHDVFTSRFSGTLDFLPDTTFVDLLVHVNDIDYAETVRLLPDTPSFRIKNWIQRSISGGKLQTVDAVFRGNTDKFPFDRRDGQFKIVAKVTGADLAYSPNWPAINAIDADLLFAGRELSINIRKGSIFNAIIDNAHASIPDLGTPQRTVYIDGQITGKTDALKKYVRQSPLNSHLLLSKTSNYFSENGNVDLGLVLTVPLNIPGRQVAVEGKLKLSETKLTTDINTLAFTNVNGEIAFTRHSVHADNVSADYKGYPVKLTINNAGNEGNSPATISISGAADETFISNEVTDYFPKYAHLSEQLTEHLAGTSNWQASLTYIPNLDDNKLERVLNISSDLYGMSILLPEPFSKNSDTRTRLDISRNLDKATAPLHFSYGKLFASSVIFDPTGQQGLQRVSVKFGDVPDIAITDNDDGALIYGQLDTFSLDEWQQFIPSRQHDSNGHDMLIIADIAVKKLQYYGQSFSETRIIAGNNDQDWQILLDGPAIKGEITIPRKPDNDNPVQANLDYVHLQKTTRGSTDRKGILPTEIPAITAYADTFSYDDMDFGKLEFAAVKSDNGLILNNILFTKPEFTVRANGKWIVNQDTENISDFNIQAHATELNRMLETFGYSNSGVNKGETHLTIDANWLGTPMDFSLDKLNGALSMQIAQGQFLDIEPAAGRLFGLLSLQALPRRLLLDFSDLLGKGMAFDSIQGSFLIENGNAHTEDLIMKGPSVDILITGRAGLTVKDYDQKAIVTPQISDSLAVATGFLGPVGIGVGTVLYLAGNMFEPLQDSINKLMKYEYSITGSWDSPVIEKYRIIQDNNG
jgi:uncharacterized protein (TIGR02099 family)